MNNGTSLNIVWQVGRVQLGEVFDFTMFKKKNVWCDCVWAVQRGEWLAGVWGWEELLEYRAISWYLGYWEDVTDAVVTFSSDCNCDVKCNLIFMIKEIPNINSVTDVDLYLWTLSRRDSHFPQSSPQPLLHGDSRSVLWLWLTLSGSDCVAHLAERRVLLGQTQDPPSGPTTRSKAPRSQSLFVLVRGTQRSSQRNPSLKWNISTWGICSSIRHKHTVLCQQSFPFHYHMKLNSSCNVSFSTPFLPRFIFHRLPVASVSPFGTIFHSIFMLFIGQNGSTPLFL